MDFWTTIGQVPREGWALVLAPVGWLGALVLRWALGGLLTLARFDALAERIGVAAFLKTGQVPYTPSRLVGLAAYWVALLSTLVGVSVLLDLDLVTAISERLAELVPGLLAATLVVIIGLLVVSFLANVTLTLARNAALAQARLVARSVRVLGILIVLAVASEQIGINMTFIHALALILVGGLALGLALAFGLGGQELAKQTLKTWASALSEKEHPRGPDLEG